jgi:hypothetical protein
MTLQNGTLARRRLYKMELWQEDDFTKWNFGKKTTLQNGTLWEDDFSKWNFVSSLNLGTCFVLNMLNHLQ